MNNLFTSEPLVAQAKAAVKQARVRSAALVAAAAL